MKIVIWNWHGDETRRVSYFTGITDTYIGSAVPECDILISADGNWLTRIPEAMRKRTIVYPCVKSLDHIKQLGYTNFFVKDSYQYEQVKHLNACILPPVFESGFVLKDIQRDAVAICHHFKARDPKGYKLTKDCGVEVYGYDEKIAHDIDLLNTSKFLLHAKTVGYLCNAVIKAVNTGTPIIFTPESYTFGYMDYLKPGFGCFIIESKQDFERVINMCESDYVDAVNNLKYVIQHTRMSYPQVTITANAVIKTVISSYIREGYKVDNNER